jgi:hypothetical protein
MRLQYLLMWSWCVAGSCRESYGCLHAIENEDSNGFFNSIGDRYDSENSGFHDSSDGKSDLESSVEKGTMRFDTKLSVRDILNYDGMCVCSECLGHEALL